MENLNKENQSEKQPSELFDIRAKAVETLDDSTIKNLQEKFVANFKYSDVPLIMKQNGFSGANSDYINSDMDKVFSRFPYFMKCLELGDDESGDMKYATSKTDIKKAGLNIFLLKSGFLKDGKYFLYTGDGQILTVNKSDFDKNGLYASSLEFFGNQGGPDFLGNTQKKIFVNEYESRNDGSGFIPFFKKGKKTLDIPGDSIFKVASNNVLICEGGKIHQYVIVDDSSYKRLETYSLPFKGISQMVVDRNQNFLLIVNETDEGSTLHIVLYDDFINKKQINEVYNIKNVKEVCGLNEGGMICLMADGSLKYYWNTFPKFKRNFFKGNEDGTPIGKLIYSKDVEVTTISDSSKSDLLQSLEDGTISVQLDLDEENEDIDKIDSSIIDKIWEMKITVNSTDVSLKELFDNANDEKSITNVAKIFAKIKREPQIAKVKGITKTIEKAINDKKNKIILDSIFSELGSIALEIQESDNLATLVTIKDKLKSIQKKRKNIQAGITQQDKDLKELLVLIDAKIDDYKEGHREEFESEIQKNLEKIKEFLADVENVIDISSIYTTSIYQATEDMINCLDDEGLEKFKKKLKEIVQNRGKEIKEKTDKIKKEEADSIERKKKDVEENIAQIKGILEEIDDIETIEQYKENDVFVQKTKDLLSELPSSDAQTLDLKLDKIFGERIFALRLSGEESKGVIQNLDTYGIDTILYYDEDGTEQVEWKIEGKEKSDGKISLIVKLMNGETHEYDKSLYLKDAEKYSGVLGVNLLKDLHIKFDMTQEEFIEYQGKLTNYKLSGKKEIQDLLNKIKEKREEEENGEKKEEGKEETKEELQKKLKEKREYYKDARYTEVLIKRLIKEQKLNPRSKVPPFNPNYIVLDEEKDILRTLSTRLVDQKQNQQGIEILEGGPGLGKTVMCEFLAGVTNREIVRVQCSKMDPSDMFFSPTLKKGETSREPADWIKLMQKPGTIILFDEIDKLNDQCIERLHSLFDGGRSVYDPQLGKVKVNPDCLFLGTRNSYDRLSNPILSRGRILQISYPSELNEAYKISKYSDSSVLKKLSYEDFQMLYDKYIIRGESAPSNVHEKRIYDLVINIKHLLNVFTTLRKQYDSDDPFAFELSYRDARQIFVDYNISGDFKLAMENVLIPKARGAVIDSEDKKTQENMVRQAIDQEM